MGDSRARTARSRLWDTPRSASSDSPVHTPCHPFPFRVICTSKAPCFFFLLSGSMPDAELSCLVFPPFGLSEMYCPLWLPVRAHNHLSSPSLLLSTCQT